MASSQRCSAVLRLAASSSRGASSNTLPYRAFSTSAYRLVPRSQNPHPPAPVRRNPLIGNFVAPEKPAPSRDEQQQKTPSTRSAPSSSSPNTPESSSSSPSSLTPPPPPPPASSFSTAKDDNQTKSDKQHPYTAASPSTPFNIDIASIIASKAAAFTSTLGSHASTDPLQQPQMRSDAAKGRTVFVAAPGERKPNTAPSVQAALRSLNRLNREDFVKAKYNSQREHERKGLKRKRLRSERWKARFKMGFKAAAERVVYLKRQGW